MSALTIQDIDALIIKMVEEVISTNIDVEEIRKFTKGEDGDNTMLCHQPLIDMLNVFHIERIGVDGVVEEIFQLLFCEKVANMNLVDWWYITDRTPIDGEHIICIMNCIRTYAREHSTPCRIDFNEEFDIEDLLNAYAYVFADYYSRTEINNDIRELIKKYVLYVQSEQKRLLDEMTKNHYAKMINMIKGVV
jgi:hypothetical protein